MNHIMKNAAAEKDTSESKGSFCLSAVHAINTSKLIQSIQKELPSNKLTAEIISTAICFDSEYPYDYVKQLHLAVLNKKIHCAAIIGVSEINQVHLLFISPSKRKLNRHEKAALLISFQEDEEIEFPTNRPIPEEEVFNKIFDWKRDFDITYAMGIVITERGIYRSGELPMFVTPFLLEEVLSKTVIRKMEE